MIEPSLVIGCGLGGPLDSNTLPTSDQVWALGRVCKTPSRQVAAWPGGARKPPPKVPATSRPSLDMAIALPPPEFCGKGRYLSPMSRSPTQAPGIRRSRNSTLPATLLPSGVI